MTLLPIKGVEDTEVILTTTELEGRTKHAYVDFVDDENVSVQNEICRGNKLRNEKPRRNETTALNVALLGPYVKQHRETERFGRWDAMQQALTPISMAAGIAALGYLLCIQTMKGHFESSNNNKRPKTLKCPCAGPNSAASTYMKMCSRISRTSLVQTNAKKGKRCPLRIAELAVPSKRQCIGTWREKSDVLPGIMVERLKQQVLDQIPIARIPEAIYCFQNEKRISSKNSTFKWLSSKQIKYEAQKPTRQMDERMLCILFGHKVGQRLSRPLELTLKADLEKLTKVVSNDIAEIMYEYPDILDEQDEVIHTDITNKVTFWITGILEDSYYKSLEDDLRAKKETEAITQTVPELESVMKSKDLEEEEGPVLDFIDDLVDNVMNICEPQPLHVFDSDSCYSGDSKQHIVSPEELEKSLDNWDSEIEKFHKEQTEDLTAEADDSLIDSNKDFSDSEYFRNEISKIINNITEESGDNLSNRFGNDIEGLWDNKENEDILLTSKIKHDINDGNKLEVSPTEEMEHDIDKRTSNTGISLDAGIEHDINEGSNEEVPLVEETEQDIRMNNTGISLETGIEHDTNDENLDKISESSPNVGASDNIDETHSNVSERFKIINDDSKTDLVNADNRVENVKTSTTEEQKLNKNRPTRWNSYNKSNIIFAEPNQDLLSDADESWPADLSDRPMLKVSDSASKSISSLGRINERYENIMLSQNEEDGNSIVSKGTIDTNTFNKVLDDMFPTGTHDTASQWRDPLTKVSTDISATDASEKQLSSKIQDEEDMRSNITFTKTKQEKRFGESCMPESHQMDSEESERERSTADTNQDNKIRSKMNQGWKVQMKTAPSWVYAWDQGRGEPSEDSIPLQKRPTKVTESELRTWCKDLEKAFINLEIWSNWISATCKESLFILKQKKLTCPCFAKKSVLNWRTLKRNVHKDVLLWTKLYQRTDKNFTILKRKYNNVEYSKPTPIANRTIFEKMREFDELRLKVHEMIVAAEYCVMCTCNKIKTTSHLNKECQNGYSTKRKDILPTCLNNNNKK